MAFITKKVQTFALFLCIDMQMSVFFLFRYVQTIIFMNYLHNSKNFRNFVGRMMKINILQ